MKKTYTDFFYQKSDDFKKRLSGYIVRNLSYWDGVQLTMRVLTRAEFMSETGVSDTMASRIFNGKSPVTPKIADRMHEIYLELSESSIIEENSSNGYTKDTPLYLDSHVQALEKMARNKLYPAFELALKEYIGSARQELRVARQAAPDDYYGVAAEENYRPQAQDLHHLSDEEQKQRLEEHAGVTLAAHTTMPNMNLVDLIPYTNKELDKGYTMAGTRIYPEYEYNAKTGVHLTDYALKNARDEVYETFVPERPVLETLPIKSPVELEALTQAEKNEYRVKREALAQRNEELEENYQEELALLKEKYDFIRI